MQMLIKADLAALYQRVYDRIFVKGDDMDLSSGSRAATSGEQMQLCRHRGAGSGAWASCDQHMVSLDEQHEKIVADLPEPEDEDMEEITTTGGRGEPVELGGL